MEAKVFLLVKVEISTTHAFTIDALKELQQQATLQLSSTENVEVIKADIMQLKSTNH